MKVILAALFLILTAGEAHALTKGARTAVESFLRRGTPIVSEIDVRQSLRRAHLKSRSSAEISEFAEVFNTKDSFPWHYAAHLGVNSATSKSAGRSVELLITARNISSTQIRRIEREVMDPDWSIIGGFKVSSVGFEKEGNRIHVLIKMDRISQDNLDHLRGIHRIIEQTLKITGDVRQSVDSKLLTRNPVQPRQSLRARQ